VTEHRRSAWSALADEWDPERDPALRLMQTALALPHTEEPTAPRGQVRQLPHLVVVTEAAQERRGRISQLVARIKAGDLSAVDLLRELLK
jgi:hypothetical protein